MAVPFISDDIRRFLHTSVPSVPYLEALLLLRSDTAHDWSAVRLACALYTNETIAKGLLEALHAGSIVVASSVGTFRYDPATAELRQLIDSLAAVYAANLVEVTHLIHARSNSKALRFADAFVWRKE
ncbi:MAG: hypothetical protein V4695_10285 [Pseudomonadota bacterium]